MTKAAQEFTKQLARTSSQDQAPAERQAQHPPGLDRNRTSRRIESSCGPKLADAGAAPSDEILQQSLLGTTMPNQLHEDKELTKARGTEISASKVGKPIGRVPRRRQKFVGKYLGRLQGVAAGVFRVGRAAGSRPGVP